MPPYNHGRLTWWGGFSSARRSLAFAGRSKDLKKMKTPDLVKEDEILKQCKTWLEQEKPLRELEMSPEDKKRLKGFMFLSEKPILYVLNISESTSSAPTSTQRSKSSGSRKPLRVPIPEPRRSVAKWKLSWPTCPTRTRLSSSVATACRKRPDAAYKKTYELLGLISFLTAGEDECRAWTITRGMRAVEAAGTIHTDLEKHFIRAETIHWDQL